MNIPEGRTTRGKRCVSIFLLSLVSNEANALKVKKKEREELEGEGSKREKNTCRGKNHK